MNTLKVGIIGCGDIAARHIEGYGACDGVEIAAGADVDVQRAADIAGPEHAYNSFHEMLASEQLDAVSVCTPPKFHKDAVCSALEAGLNVLCEAPFSTNASDARTMVAAAEKTGKLLAPAFRHRFYELMRRAREIIRSGKVGKVTMFRNRFGSETDIPETNSVGTILDIHSIDLFRYMIGNPIKVAAATETVDSRHKAEDCSVIMLQTRDGAIGTIEASRNSPGSANIIEVYGTNGAVVVDYISSTLRYMLGTSNEWHEEIDREHDGFVEQARHFIDCIRGLCISVVNGIDGLRAMEISDAAYEFVHSNRMIDLTSNR